MKQLCNPFLVYGYESPEYFCDRAAETSQLISDLSNGWNVALVSPRRMGKTGLIMNAFYRLGQEQKSAVCIYVDIFGTNDLPDFVQALGAAVLDAIAHEGHVAAPNSGQFVARYRLTSASSVSSALKALVDKELVFKAPGGYNVYDRFFGMWLSGR